MAPEALLRGHISKAADVYSFGVTLWELFTGCHAYHGEPEAHPPLAVTGSKHVQSVQHLVVHPCITSTQLSGVSHDTQDE
jgi:serine/threonine protein kinase